jgi:hypothetical protein
MSNHSNPAGSHSGHSTGLVDLLVHSSVGTPLTRDGIALFPLYLHGPTAGTTTVVTGAGADVSITEQASAEVPTIIAENRQPQPVLLIDGQVVEGGRQTRTLNVSVLLDGHTRLPIPVSCVEAGRWNGGIDFRHSGQMVNRRVRRAKHLGVEQSIRSHGAKRSDQGAVWSAISSELDALGVASQSSAFTAAADRLDRDSLGRKVREIQAMGPLPGQCGVVVAHGRRIVSMEVFATPAMLAAHWNAIVQAVFLDTPARLDGTPSATKALRFVRHMAKGDARTAPGVGLGTEHHVRTRYVAGQALVHDGMVVHASAFALAA